MQSYEHQKKLNIKTWQVNCIYKNQSNAYNIWPNYCDENANRQAQKKCISGAKQIRAEKPTIRLEWKTQSFNKNVQYHQKKQGGSNTVQFLHWVQQQQQQEETTFLCVCCPVAFINQRPPPNKKKRRQVTILSFC